MNTLQEFADKHKIRLIRNQSSYYNIFRLDGSDEDKYQFVKTAKAEGWSPETYREAKAILLLEYETKLYVRSKEPWLAAV
jgi:hypothetical protein